MPGAFAKNGLPGAALQSCGHNKNVELDRECAARWRLLDEASAGPSRRKALNEAASAHLSSHPARMMQDSEFSPIALIALSLESGERSSQRRIADRM